MIKQSELNAMRSATNDNQTDRSNGEAPSLQGQAAKLALAILALAIWASPGEAQTYTTTSTPNSIGGTRTVTTNNDTGAVMISESRTDYQGRIQSTYTYQPGGQKGYNPMGGKYCPMGPSNCR